MHTQRTCTHMRTHYYGHMCKDIVSAIAPLVTYVFIIVNGFICLPGFAQLLLVAVATRQYLRRKMPLSPHPFPPRTQFVDRYVYYHWATTAACVLMLFVSYLILRICQKYKLSKWKILTTGIISFIPKFKYESCGHTHIHMFVYTYPATQHIQ